MLREQLDSLRNESRETEDPQDQLIASTESRYLFTTYDELLRQHGKPLCHVLGCLVINDTSFNITQQITYLDVPTTIHIWNWHGKDKLGVGVKLTRPAILYNASTFFRKVNVFGKFIHDLSQAGLDAGTPYLVVYSPRVSPPELWYVSNSLPKYGQGHDFLRRATSSEIRFFNGAVNTLQQTLLQEVAQ